MADDYQKRVKMQQEALGKMPPPMIQDMNQPEEAPSNLTPDDVDGMTRTPSGSDQHMAILSKFTDAQLQAALTARQQRKQAQQPLSPLQPGTQPTAPAPGTVMPPQEILGHA